jgi:uncharacterized membrane protein
LLVYECPLIGLFLPQFKQVKQPKFDIYFLSDRACVKAQRNYLVVYQILLYDVLMILQPIW